MKNVRIFIFCPKYLGDNVFYSGIYKFLMDLHPNAQFILYQRGNIPQQLFKATLGSNLKTVINYRGMCKTILTLIALSIKSQRFDITINLSGISYRNKILSFFVRTKKRYHFSPERDVFTKKLPDGEKVRKVLWRKNNIVAFADWCSAIFKTKFNPCFLDFVKREHVLSELNDNYAVIACSASTTLKMWNPDNWNKASKYISTKYGLKIVLIGGNASHEVEIASKITCDVNLLGKTSLQDAINIISKAKLVLAHDSGLMHLSNALNVKTIAIFADTDPEIFGYKWLSTFYSIKTTLPCHPCYRSLRSCPYDKPYNFKCIREITFEQVKAVIDAALQPQ